MPHLLNVIQFFDQGVERSPRPKLRIEFQRVRHRIPVKAAPPGFEKRGSVEIGDSQL
jgi:hypothetical protein